MPVPGPNSIEQQIRTLCTISDRRSLTQAERAYLRYITLQLPSQSGSRFTIPQGPFSPFVPQPISNQVDVRTVPDFFSTNPLVLTQQIMDALEGGNQGAREPGVPHLTADEQAELYRLRRLALDAQESAEAARIRRIFTLFRILFQLTTRAAVAGPAIQGGLMLWGVLGEQFDRANAEINAYQLNNSLVTGQYWINHANLFYARDSTGIPILNPNANLSIGFRRFVARGGVPGLTLPPQSDFLVFQQTPSPQLNGLPMGPYAPNEVLLPPPPPVPYDPRLNPFYPPEIQGIENEFLARRAANSKLIMTDAAIVEKIFGFAVLLPTKAQVSKALADTTALLAATRVSPTVSLQSAIAENQRQLTLSQGVSVATPVPSEFRAKCVRAGTNNNVVYLDGAPILYFPVFAQGKRFATKLNAAFAYAVKTASFSDSGAGNQLGDFFTQAANPANGFNPTLPVGS